MPALGLLVCAAAACAPAAGPIEAAPPVARIAVAAPAAEPEEERVVVARGESQPAGAPEIQGRYLGGAGPRTLLAARGKVVLVHFWATFCDPCRQSFPAYQALVDRFGGRLAVIGVSVDDPEDASAASVQAFASQHGGRFVVVWDERRATAQAWSPPRLPTTYLLNTEGAMVATYPGYQSEDAERTAQEVSDLLAE
jgi:cytochrome c biogenesis protein CcmG, thiol:disulfide interchange protein DsbE